MKGTLYTLSFNPCEQMKMYKKKNLSLTQALSMVFVVTTSCANTNYFPLFMDTIILHRTSFFLSRFLSFKKLWVRCSIIFKGITSSLHMNVDDLWGKNFANKVRSRHFKKSVRDLSRKIMNNEEDRELNTKHFTVLSYRLNLCNCWDGGLVLIDKCLLITSSA